MYDAGSSNLVFCNNLEGWGGVGGELEETCVYLWLIHADVWQKPTQYHKAIILQFPKKKKSEMVHSHETSFSLGCLLFKKKKKNRCRKQVLVRIWRNINLCAVLVRM